MRRLLVVDVGTSSVRAAIVDGDARVVTEHRISSPPESPEPGWVQFDARSMARSVLEVARAALEVAGPVDAVGIANQRGSTVVWDRATGEPVGPGIGWQDLRTVGRCLELRAAGVRVAPNHSATKIEHLLDGADPDRSRDLCVGTVDSWIAWTLSDGEVHVTDATNALLTGLRTPANDAWNTSALHALRIPEAALPAVVDSSGIVGPSRALDGAPPIAGLLGDQQASLLGQGCTTPGDAKITFGTGAMLDVVLGPTRPSFAERGSAGTCPVVTRRTNGADTWGLEAILLSAGSSIEWLRDDLGVLASAEESDELAARCDDSGGVWFVPALLGLGTPHWDYGARAAFVGLTRGSDRAQLVRSVIEGIAHRGADLVEAAESDAACSIEILRVDGGMSTNTTFVQALADASRRPVEVAPIPEATTLGAAFTTGLATGVWAGDDDVAATWAPSRRVEPARHLDRERWREAVARAAGWIPELSAIDF